MNRQVLAVAAGFVALTAGEVGLFLWLNGPEIAEQRADVLRDQTLGDRPASPQGADHVVARPRATGEPAAPLRARGYPSGATESPASEDLTAPEEPRARLGAADRLMEQGRFVEAAEAYERHLIKWPDDRIIRLRLAEALNGLQAFDRAAIQYRIVLKQSPGDGETRLKLARALSWSRRYEESIEEYQRVLGDR